MMRSESGKPLRLHQRSEDRKIQARNEASFTEYTPNSNSIDKLENIDQKYHLIVFSANGAETCRVRSGTCKDTRDRKETT